MAIHQPRWIEPLGDPRAWSTGALITSLIVSTLTFTLGNLELTREAPVISVGGNTVLTIAVFVLSRILARAVSARLSSIVAGVAVLSAIFMLAALRGVVLYWLFALSDLDSAQSALMRAIVSLTVFSPGLILSVLVLGAIRQWLADEARIRELVDQRERTKETVVSAIAQHSRDLDAHLRGELEPRLDAMKAFDPEQSRQALSDMVSSIVRPVSHSLHASFPTVEPVPPRTVSVAVREFFSLAMARSPLAPGLTGIIFAVTLLPRNFAAAPPLEALAWSVGLGVTIFLGTSLINTITRALPHHLPLSLRMGIVVGLLLALGAGIAELSWLLSSSNLGFDNALAVGAAATTTLAVLLGGVVNARRYFASQREQVVSLEEELDREVSRVRQLQWQRNRTLENLLHGSLQSALNAGNIRLAKATSPEEVEQIITDISSQVTHLLSQLHSATVTPTDLRHTIQRISDTWEGITELLWSTDEALLEAVANHPVSSAMSDVLVEAVYNAVKHQSPAEITVSLSHYLSGEIRLVVSHTGNLSNPNKPGLGTRMIDYLTLQHSLTESSGVVTFEARFPGYEADFTRH